MVKDTDTEKNILINAKEVFIAEGYDGARMQHIADRAGINKSLLHYYFRTKEKLFLAVFEQTFDEVLSRIFPVVEANASLDTLLRVFFKEHIGFILKEPRLPAFIISELSLHPELLTTALKKFSVKGMTKFAELVEMEKENGKVHPDLDYRQLMMNMLSLSIFPILAQPVLKEIFNMSDRNIEGLIRQRMEYLPDMVMASITRPERKT